MEKHSFYLEEKFVSHISYKYDVEAETKEEAIKLVKKHIHINHVIKQGIQLGFVDKKELYDSEGTFIEEIKFKEKEIIPFSDSEEEYILL